MERKRNKRSKLAETQNIAVEDVFASAFADYFAAWQRLQERAARGDSEKFLAVLERVRDVEPADYDRL